MRCPGCGAETRDPSAPHFWAGRWCEGESAPENEAGGSPEGNDLDRAQALLQGQTLMPEEAPPPMAPETAVPVVTVYGHRVTTSDVREALLALGDEALASYEAGTLSAESAYRLAANRLRQGFELRGRGARR